MNEFLSIIVFGVAAFLASIVTLLCMALVLDWGHKREEGLLPYLFYLLLFSTVLTILLSGRDIMSLPSELVVQVPLKIERHQLAVWAARLTSLYMLFGAGERIAQRLFSPVLKTNAPVLLILAFLFYCLTNAIIPTFLSPHTTISHENFYMVIVGFGALLITQQGGVTAVKSARNALYMVMIASAMLLAWRPEMVLIRGIQTYIPGLELRYAGLGNHPNSFGPLAVMFMFCLWSKPYSSAWLNRFGWIIGCLSLLLTQSKTSWFAFVLGSQFIVYFHYGESFKRWFFDFRHPQLPVALVVLLMVATSGLFILTLYYGGVEAIESFFSTREGSKLLTLTGRDQIWEIAVNEWRRNPLVGYGLDIWNEDYRAQIGIDSAVSAHNQFFQSLASTGIVGVIGLLIYVMTLILFAFKTAKSSRGLSLAIISVIMCESIAEVPLSISRPGMGVEQMTHLLFLMVIVSHTVVAIKNPNKSRPLDSKLTLETGFI